MGYPSAKKGKKKKETSLFALFGLLWTLLFLLQDILPALERKIEVLPSAFQSIREARSHALQSHDKLAAQAIHATFDTANPLRLVDVKHAAVHTRSKQVQLRQTFLHALLMPCRVCSSGWRRVADRFGGED